MSLALFPELEKLPDQEKFRLAEDLWLAAMNDKLPVPAQDRQVLDNRWQAYQEGRVARISLAEMERRLSRNEESTR